MAVTYQTKEGNMEFLSKLGISSTLQDKLTAENIVVKLGVYDMTLTHTPTGACANVKMAVSANEVMKGFVPAPVLTAVRGAVVSLIEDLLKTIGGDGGNQLSVGGVMGGPRVPLNQATLLYQPVRGTDGTSRYFVVAIHDRFKVAARIINETVSVRVEGNFQEGDDANFDNVGLGQKTSGHWSGHYQLGPHVSAARLLGSILVGMEVKFNTQMPEVSNLEGMGL
jgi:hypothetical protein